MAPILPFLPLIISGAVGGTELGMKLAGVGEPSAPKPIDTSQQDAAAKAAEANAKKQAFLTAAPGVQERLGGSVSPDFFADEVARVSGNPADRQMAEQALSQLLGLGSSPANVGTTSQTSPIGSFAGGQGSSPFGKASGTFPGTEQFGGGIGGGFFSQFTGGDEGGTRGFTGDYS